MYHGRIGSHRHIPRVSRAYIKRIGQLFF